MSCIERQHGLTLIELIVFIVIVGASIAGVLSVFVQATRGSADPLIRKQALSIAESLLEEIQAVPYVCPSTCTTVTTSNRTGVHQIGDYDGFTMTGTIRSIDGTQIVRLDGYTVSVAVAAETSWSGVNGRQITVTAGRGTESVALTGWRGSY